MFIDREIELSKLRKMPPGIGLLYGRRRIGKTRLAKEARPDATYIFSPTFEGSPRDLLRIILRKVSRGEDIIIDEVQTPPRTINVIREAYELLRHSGLRKGRLLMITSLRSYAFKLLRSPAITRIVFRLKLEPLEPKDAIKLAPEEAYFLYGGIPRYLELYSRFGEESIEVLRDELEHLLYLETGEPAIYMSILAKLRRRPVKTRELKETAKDVEIYLEKLEKIGFVRKLYSLGRHFYRDISDPFARTRLTYNSGISLAETISANFEAFFRDPKVIEKLLGRPDKIGYHDNPEIDSLVRINGKLYAIEVKYSELSEERKEKEKEKLMEKLAAIRLKAEPIIVDLSTRREIMYD